MRKELSHVMLELHNERMEPLDVKKKKGKGTTQREKKTVTCDIGTTQCEDRTVKFYKKSKGTIQYNKRTVICNVGTA